MTSDIAICLAGAAAAAYTDWQFRKVRNLLVMPLLLLGLLGAGVSGNLPELRDALLGAMLPLVLVPFFVLRMLGAGDIKLLMALGCWVGLVESATLLLYSVLAGGIMALAVLAVRRNGRQRMERLWVYFKVCVISGKALPYQDFSAPEEGAALPFALAVMGGVICLWFQRLGFIPALL